MILLRQGRLLLCRFFVIKVQNYLSLFLFSIILIIFVFTISETELFDGAYVKK